MRRVRQRIMLWSVMFCRSFRVRKLPKVAERLPVVFQMIFPFPAFFWISCLGKVLQSALNASELLIPVTIQDP